MKPQSRVRRPVLQNTVDREASASEEDAGAAKGKAGVEEREAVSPKNAVADDRSEWLRVTDAAEERSESPLHRHHRSARGGGGFDPLISWLTHEPPQRRRDICAQEAGAEGGG